MPTDTSPQTRGKEKNAIKTLRQVRGENALVGGTRDFLHFLLDYNIVSFTISFIVARSALNVISKVTPLIIRMILGIFGSRVKDIGEIITSLITFGFVLLLCFLFIQYIFQPIITSKNVSEERELKELVKIAEKEKIKHKVNSVSSSMSFIESTY